MAARVGATKNEALPGSLLLVIHNFVARSADELSLAKGDRVELIERDDDFGDGWFLGRHLTNGNTGLFPEVYTTPAPKGAVSSSPVNRRASDGPQKSTSVGVAAMAAAAATASPQRHSSGPSTRPVGVPAASGSLRSSVMSGAPLHTDSSVMNETLSVIDEHMNDMHGPRLPFANGNQRDTIASSIGSIYSANNAPDRVSYIAGHETDEEEQHLHTEAEVMAWGPDRVAEYLEDQGVEKMHCEVFRDQEITGEVLLAMDQSSLFIKEFELGPVGRRLKTWHKIKALQDEVKLSATQFDHASGLPGGTDGMGRDTARNRASTVGSAAQALPRALSATTRAGDSPVRNGVQPVAPINPRQSGVSPLQTVTLLARGESPYRPSAQTIRAMQHSRRHSSIDSTANSIESSSRTGHRKQPSIDQQWQPGQAQVGASRAGHSYALSTDSVMPRRPGATPGELDRGHFSFTELGDTSITGRTESATRAVAAATIPALGRSNTDSTQFAGSTVSHDAASAGASPVTSSAPWGSMNVVASKTTGLRSATSPALGSLGAGATTSDGTNPIVTKLDYDDGSATPGSVAEGGKTSSPTTYKFPFFSAQKAKVAGLRTASDAVTKEEKMTFTSEKESPGRPGMATPSTDTGSIDMQKSEAQSRHSQGSSSNLVAPPPTAKRPRARTKTKKLTSAYTRGLEKKTPAQQMHGCDYSGWMKKKSGSLMTTWKPRLFILRGRRLSYYYADDDTEEKGLIDISFHRVLPAQNEMLTGLHASLTGAATPAASNPASPKLGGVPETAASLDLRTGAAAGDVDPDGEGLFIFKLVPPRTGLAKGVSFTKPTVHYFAVNSRREGRLWMAALMKATIDRDADGVVTTSYNQKTISLAKARARKERPPALKDQAGGDENEDDDDEDDDVVDDGYEGARIDSREGAAAASAPLPADPDTPLAADTTTTTVVADDAPADADVNGDVTTRSGSLQQGLGIDTGTDATAMESSAPSTIGEDEARTAAAVSGAERHSTATTADADPSLASTDLVDSETQAADADRRAWIEMQDSRVSEETQELQT